MTKLNHPKQGIIFPSNCIDERPTLGGSSRRANVRSCAHSRPSALSRRTLCQNPLQGAAVHVQPARGFGDIVVA